MNSVTGKNAEENLRKKPNHFQTYIKRASFLLFMVTRTYQERFKTLKGVFDEFTNRTIFTLQSQGVFDDLLSPLSVGKESNVFIGQKEGKKVIVKIYRVQNCDFKRMFSYIGKDPRYAYLQRQRRQIVFAWAQREYRNLLWAAKAKVRVPEALGWLQHIIVEEMIGTDIPAPRLKDGLPENPQQFLDLIIAEMQKLYRSGLIHGDLSAFNILNDKENPVFIDFSQATMVKTPNSEELLERDIKNLVQFFAKLHVRASSEEIFKKVAGK